MKNFDLAGLHALLKLYRDAIRHEAPRLAPYLRVVCFFGEKSYKGDFQFIFEIHLKKGKPDRPINIYLETAGLFPSFKIKNEERALAKRLGVIIMMDQANTDTGFSYNKSFSVPKNILPANLRRERRLLQRRCDMLIRISGHVSEAGHLLENKLVSTKAEILLKRAEKLRERAKPRSFWNDVYAHEKAVKQYIGLGRALTYIYCNEF